MIRLQSTQDAATLVSRGILIKGIYELWGSGSTYDELHANIRERTSSQWGLHRSCSFKFEFDAFNGSRPLPEQQNIIKSFSYMSFEGPIRLRNPDQTFTVFEEYVMNEVEPQRIYLGRYIAGGDRRSIVDYSLKKRDYINTTSMDSELALLTANLTLAAPNKIFYDPFVGTGSFPIACSHFGALTLGSDLDGRVVRGKNGKDVKTNFRQYGLLDKYLDGFISDLTHSPFRLGRWLDGIVCDPPYGVREGLKVLGAKDGKGTEAVFINGQAAHL